MLTNLDYRLAAPEDADGIVACVRSGFSPEFLSLTIYGCPGIARFVAAQASAHAAGADTVYAVAALEKTIVACVELRRLPDILLLSYISVVSEARSGGIGKQLLKWAIERVRDKRHRVLELDVLENNRVALAWYEKLGMRERYSTEWWHLPPAPFTGERFESVYVEGYAQAEVCHQAFGFSQFFLSAPHGRWPVGRIGGDWFRVTDAELLSKSELTIALSQIDSDRRLLAVLRANQMPADLIAQSRPLTRTRRLIGDLDEIASRIGAKVQDLRNGD